MKSSTPSHQLTYLAPQNFGDTGGRSTALKDYNYETLSKWFFLMDHLDAQSDYIPYLASYYFGSTQDVSTLYPVLDYLEHVGSQKEGQKWRWLAHAVYLARFRINDYDKALELAKTLASIEYDDAPNWVKQMPAFVLSAKGDKKAAYAMLLEILKTSGKKLHPNEIAAMKAYICNSVLVEEEASTNPLCETVQ